MVAVRLLFPALVCVAAAAAEPNCTVAAIEQFPRPLMSPELRQQGAIVVHVLAALYMFAALSIICEDYFVPSLELICDEVADYLSAYEKELRARAARYKGILCRRALWSYSQYEVMRALWKMVAVLALTYADAVLYLSTGVREFLERRQREIGRLALGGVHKHTPMEAIQGEMGWSSFTAREAVAKAGYENRLVRLPEQNVVRSVLVHTIFPMLHVDPDVAGATFMAAASSVPAIAASIIAIMVAKAGAACRFGL
ncbi:hypothetical protein HPB52_010572 [Rhipicephalus sanguineus]|uniref:Uncharacterized protein n=1 Tax=Rhipicephalus sanguineus TaxID=34632 RepID=A0A9D4YPA1_RHISA|nr:hypothetical protein HPB52_010572 [Rhipicephalus sanguineus]